MILNIPPVGAAGGPITFGISLVTSILGSLFGGLFGGPDVGKLAQAVNDLRSALASTADQLKRFSWSVAFGLGKLFSAFHDIWSTFFDGLWGLVKNLARALWKVMGEILPKLIDVVRKVRTLIDTIYTKYVRPILNHIQLIRRYLAILRALHVPFAAKLDGYLVKVEGKIIGPFLYVLRTLNGFGGWFNVILTTRGTIQRAVFVRSLWENQGAAVNLWWASQLAGGSGGAVVTTPGAGSVTQAAAIADVQVYAQTGGGQLAIDLAPAIAETQAAAGV